MSNLIIDAASDKILLKIIFDNQSYTNEYSNNRENFDKLPFLIFNFLKKNNKNIEEISNIFVNHGPGKFSGVRLSIVISKAICMVYNIKLYSFCSNQIDGNNYSKLLDLLEKGDLISNLIKPKYFIK